MKQVIIDSSSAILLEKTQLFQYLTEQYTTILTVAVFTELTNNSHTSATYFKKGYSDRQFQVTPFTPASPQTAANPIVLPRLNVGERETILQFVQGLGDFIIIDDGKGAKVCFRQNLPFISALLFPKILFLARCISEQDCEVKTQEIIRQGRYSRQIIDVAENLTPQELKPFLP